MAGRVPGNGSGLLSEVKDPRLLTLAWPGAVWGLQASEPGTLTGQGDGWKGTALPCSVLCKQDRDQGPFRGAQSPAWGPRANCASILHAPMWAVRAAAPGFVGCVDEEEPPF